MQPAEVALSPSAEQRECAVPGEKRSPRISAIQTSRLQPIPPGFGRAAKGWLGLGLGSVLVFALGFSDWFGFRDWISVSVGSGLALSV